MTRTGAPPAGAHRHGSGGTGSMVAKTVRVIIGAVSQHKRKVMEMKWVAFILGTLLVGAVAMGAPLSLCDYHAPQTSLANLKLAFSYHYFDDPATAGVEVDSGRIALDYSQLYDSPDFGFTLSGAGSLDLAGFAVAGGLGQGTGTFRYYLSDELPVFGFGGADASYALGQAGPAVNVSVGLGYGRFSDVTPLAKAVKIQNDLLQLGAISTPLSDATLMAVATEIGKKAEYAATKDLVAAVEQLIEKETGGTLDARAVITIEDDILATGDSVSCGWAVQAGLGYELIDPAGGTQDLILTLSGDAAFAVKPGSQFALHASLHGPFDIAAGNTLMVTASWTYPLKRDVDLIMNYQLQRVQQGGAVTDSQSATFSVAFNVGGANVSLQLGLTKAAGAADWSKDFTVSAGMDLI